MSQDISAFLLVGGNVWDLFSEDEINNADIRSLAESHDLKVTSPSYDSSPDEWEMGFMVSKQIVDDLHYGRQSPELLELHHKYFKLTGVRAMLFAAVDVT